MARQGIGTGSAPNDGTGDNLRTGAAKINDNFSEIYTYFGDGTNLSFSGGGGVWNTVSAGINTLSSVGIGTTNPRFTLEVGAVGASGTSLYVNGDARITGILTVGSSSISLNGSTNEITVGTGITINGNTGIISATQVNIGGEILTGAGVTSLVAGSNITLSGSTGQVTINSSGGGSAGVGGTWSNYDGVTGVTTTKKVKIQNNLEVTGVTTSTGGFVGALTGNVTGNATGLSGSPSFDATDITCNSIFNNAGGGATWSLTNTGNATFSGNVSVGGVSGIQVGAALNLNYQTNTSTLSHNNVNGLFNIESVSAINLKPGPSGVLAYHDNDVLRFKTTTEGANIYGNLSVGIGSTESTNTPTLTLSHNNPTIAGTSGTTGNIKSIGGAPFYYDGTNWREFVLATGTPVSQPEDTDWDNVIIRNDFDTSLTEQRFGQTVYAGSSTNVDLVTSPVKVGTKSARLGFPSVGNAYALAYPKRSQYDFTGAWTIEGWWYLDTLPVGTATNAVPLVAHTYLAASTWGLTVETVSTNLYFRWMNNSSSSHSYTNTGGRGTGISGAYSSTILDQAWAHIALVRKASNGSIHLFVNGTESTATSSDQIIDNDIPAFTDSYELWFGKCRIAGTTDIWMDGNIDDIRVSTSERYTSNFNPPTTALPISGTGSTAYTPPGSKQGEISLGGSPAWTGTTGVTASQIAAGQYRATFASAYSNATDYVIQTSMNDYTPATTPVGIGVSRFTTHADFFINRVSDGVAIDTGSLAIDLFKK